MNTILTFIHSWVGTALPTIFLLFLGLFMTVLAATVLWDRKIGPKSSLQGTSLAATLIILFTVSSVFVVGLSAPQVMIGDEVTHFYMMKNQAHLLPQPNFHAKIPTNWGTTEVRTYPHSFLWHYLAAVVYRISGGSFALVQLYQALFLTQFLGMAYLLARSRRGIQTKSALPYLLVLASIPMTLLFSVTFYQDIPMAAQILTGFYLLRKNRWLLASFFMCLAIGIKVTAILFFPAFFVLLLVWGVQQNGFFHAVARCACSLIIISLCTWGLAQAITLHTNSNFYPVEKACQLLAKIRAKTEEPIPADQPLARVDGKSPVAAPQKKMTPERDAAIIANHPGDLRIKKNFFIYGGILLWLFAVAGGLATVMQYGGMRCSFPVKEKTWWLWGVGLSYSLLVGFFLRTAPDARFFLPALPFLLLPVAEKTICFPRPKWLISLVASLAIIQGGYVLAKTYNLRRVSPEIKSAISYLEQSPPTPNKIFMYPEGNYRLFPAPHEWYMHYHLREFWRADNATRLKMLHHYGVGAIVIKKYLISPVDTDITNLGVYPDYFVDAIGHDSRFKKVFENSGIVIYQIAPSKKGS